MQELHVNLINAHNVRTIEGKQQDTPEHKQKKNIIDGLNKKLFLDDFVDVEFVTRDDAYINRHAEEFLCDRVFAMRGQSNTVFSIYGKRRPCTTCRGKMDNLKRIIRTKTDGNRSVSYTHLTLPTILLV